LDDRLERAPLSSFNNKNIGTLMPDISAATIAARLDWLPPSGAVRRLITLISLGACFEYYDLFFTAYIGPGLVKSGVFAGAGTALLGFHGLASFVAALFAGMFVGTLLFTPLSDRYGRRSIFTFALLWYSLATIVMAFQETAFGVDLWRFIASVGIGVELVNVDAYISELVPKDRRGAAFGYNQFITFLIVPVVAFLSWVLVPREVLGLAGWRVVVLIGSTGALFIWWIRFGLPESPRWLAQHGYAFDADRITTELEQEAERATGRKLPPPEPEAGESDKVAGSWFEIWRRPYLGRTTILVIFNLFQTVGYYGFASWVPTFLISEGVTVTHSLEYTFIIAIANPVGPLLGMQIADRMERKWQIAAAAILIAVFGVLFSQQRSAVGIIAFGILVTLANNWMSFSFHAFQAELYPTRIRAQAVGFVYSWSRFSAIFSSFIIAFFLAGWGTAGVFAVIALCMVIVAITMGGFGPRTTRRRLEAVAR
jgi:MFS transporter, putative metabolite:H+ symporter